jgi:hypothetical protein
MESKMTFYRIEYPAYFCAKDNADRPANTLHVNGAASRDLHIAQIADKGCTEFTVTELTAVEYRAVARAMLPKFGV